MARAAASTSRAALARPFFPSWRKAASARASKTRDASNPASPPFRRRLFSMATPHSSVRAIRLIGSQCNLESLTKCEGGNEHAEDNRKQRAPDRAVRRGTLLRVGLCDRPERHADPQTQRPLRAFLCRSDAEAVLL